MIWGAKKERKKKQNVTNFLLVANFFFFINQGKLNRNENKSDVDIGLSSQLKMGTRGILLLASKGWNLGIFM